jgi:hypothetical protein
MDFDPTVIANIGGQGADMAGATARGYQLSDIVDKQQIGRMQLNAEKQSQTDLQTLRSLSSKHDLSTPEGQTAFAGEAIKVNPEMGIKLQKQFSELQSGQVEQTKNQYDILTKQHEMYGSALEPLYLQGQQMRQAGASQDQIDAALLGPASEALKMLGSTMLPNGKPAMDPNQIQQLGGHLAQGNILQNIEGALGQNQQTREWLKSQQPTYGKTTQMVGPQGPGVYRTNPKTGEMEYMGGIPQTAAQQTAATGGIDDDTASMLAGQLLEGAAVRDVMPGLSPRDRAKVNNELTQQMKDRGYSPAMSLAKRMQLRGTQKAMDRAGTQAGGIAIAIQELIHFAPLALAASDKVSRTSFVPFNKLMQMGEQNISDPDLASFAVNTQSVLNAYNQVAARGGAGNVDAQQHNRELLGNAQDPAAYKAVINAITAEANAAEKAAQAAMVPSLYNPALGQSPTPPPSESPSPPPGAAASGAPVQIQNNDDWAKLPSGQEFLDPNGVLRVKQ